ncbi:MAG: hypothetical protein ACT4N9_01840 [Paracoccaceae bacterium]
MRAARFSDYRELLFHIGLHKTGTSFLQALMRANADALHGAGIHFPDYRDPTLAALRDGNHTTAVNKSAPGLPLAQALDQHLDLSAPCPALLLSAEHFSTPSWIAALACEAELLAQNPRPCFVVYLRRYDELSESVWSQAVKDWDIGPFTSPYHDVDLGLLPRLAPLIAAYGAGALTIRPHNPLLRVDGALGADFFTALGRPEIWPLMINRREESRNVRLSRSHGWLLSQVRERRQKRRLLAHFADHPLPVPPDASRFFLSPAERRALNQAGLAADREMFDAMGIRDPVAFLDLESFPDAESWTPFEPDRKALDPYLAEFLAIPVPKARPPPPAKPPAERAAEPDIVRIAKVPFQKPSPFARLWLKILKIGGKP